MKGHEEIERILASYRDATPQDRATADAHMKTCPQCAARLLAYGDVDAKLAGLSQPPLPASLSQPLTALVARAGKPPSAPSRSPGALGFAFRGLVPAGLILFVVAALSVVLWSVNSVRAPVTSTPTLTMTLTPTTITTQTQVVGFKHVSPTSTSLEESGPTPAPIPAPVVQPSVEPAAAHSPILLVGYFAHAKITN